MLRRLPLTQHMTVLFAALCFTQTSFAETTNCTTINSVPVVITTQGLYCLTHNVNTGMTMGKAIEIQTNNVTIDLNGFKLGGLAAGPETGTVGIYAYQKKNIAIRNGSIRGFFEGIFLEDSLPTPTGGGHLIEDMLMDGNTNTGILAMGSGNTIRNNRVVNTGGSTVATFATGINSAGDGASILANDITNTTADNNMAMGIYVQYGDGTLLEDNRVRNTTVINNAGFSGVIPSAYGTAIKILNSNNVNLRENTLTTATYGLVFDTSYGKYMDTLTGNIIGAAYNGGTPIGTND